MRLILKKFCMLVIVAAVIAAYVPIGYVAAEGDEIVCGTTIPEFLYDFTAGDFQSISSVTNLTAEETENGVLLTALTDDPVTQLDLPEGKCKDLAYMSVMFRSNFKIEKRYAEIYYATATRSIEEKTKNNWIWEKSSGDWATQTVKLSKWLDIDEELTTFRFDPIASNSQVDVEEGESIEIGYIGFFANQADADAFDITKYREYIEALNNKGKDEGFGKPEYKEIKAIAADNAEGTLKISAPKDGSYEMSYVLNGKEVKYTLPDSNFYRNGPLAGTDDLGRTLNNQYSVVKPDYTSHDSEGNLIRNEVSERTVGVYGENGEHYVGIFYFLWLGQNSIRKSMNIEEIVAMYGEQAKDATLKEWGNVYDVFFFAEPLYGYYSSTDEWVVRKHMELLTNAGIDFLYFDTTNNYIYSDVVKIIQKVCHEMNEQGLKAPKIVFYTHTDAKTRVKQIYTSIYKKGEYTDTWLYLDGKPLIIAPQDANVDGFFTIREPQWPNEPKQDNTWPWIDWQWPQELYGPADDQLEAISVSVAQHSGNGEFSTSGLYGYTGNRGRSYDGTNANLTADSYKLGLNIQRQFNFAYNAGGKYVLVTGWNEWIASRQETVNKKTPVRFIDTFNYEYSRDIEMSKGGYFDNYYMQLASNTAMIKGAVPGVLRDDRHLINVTGDFNQWDAVPHTYADVAGDAIERNFRGSMVGKRYTDSSARNDIVAIKVTNDATNIHFYVECAGDIVPGEAGSSWLQILVDVDSNGTTGCLGYDYIINNRVIDGLTTTVAAYGGARGGTDWNFKEKISVPYRVEGKKFMVSVPMEALGIEYINKINLQFKVCDSNTLYTTCEQFYTEGDCAPLGRPNFVYSTYFPGVSEIELIKVVKAEERASKLENDDSLDVAGVEKPETPEPAGPKGCGGCGGAGGGIAVAVAAAVAALLMSKRREGNK